MFQNVKFALFLSLALSGVAAAEPQTVSYYSGACPGGTCDLVASLPAQGFVLTDIISNLNNGYGITVIEVDGSNAVTKAGFLVGQLAGNGGRQLPLSYHLNSGIPFVGGRGLRLEGQATQNWTLVGYIPGTAAGSVPAVGGVGLTVLVVAMVAAGGYILKRRQAAPAA